MNCTDLSQRATNVLLYMVHLFNASLLLGFIVVVGLSMSFRVQMLTCSSSLRLLRLGFQGHGLLSCPGGQVTTPNQS
jgi:hypothetical protein